MCTRIFLRNGLGDIPMHVERYNPMVFDDEVWFIREECNNFILFQNTTNCSERGRISSNL